MKVLAMLDIDEKLLEGNSLKDEMLWCKDSGITMVENIEVKDDLFIDNLKIQSQYLVKEEDIERRFVYFLTEEILKGNEVFFAIYDEDDREHGTPYYEGIDIEDLEYSSGVLDILSCAGEYYGDGCIEIRIRDKEADETETYIYSDNEGYKFISKDF